MATLEKAKAMSITTIVCNENRVKQLPDNLMVVNAELFRVEGTWAAYQYNNSILDKLWADCGNQLKIKGFSLRAAASKWIYWTNYRTGALEACINKEFASKPVLRLTKYASDNRLKELVKYYKNYFSNNWKALRRRYQGLNLQIDRKAEIAILVNNDFEILLYKYIIGHLSDQNIIVFHYGNINLQHDFLINDHILLIDLSKISFDARQRFVSPFRLTTEGLYMANILYQNWHSIGSEIARYDYIKQTGVKKILINVGENLPLRNLMKPVFGHSIQVYNAMNGMKSGEAHDSDINFDKWFVWDQEMKELLMRTCHLKSETLVVTGHLSEDHIRHHQFENSIKLDLEAIKDKKIITVFSVRGNRKEKVDAFNLLYRLLKDHPDWLIVVKPHPLEKKADYIWPEVDNSNVIYVEESLKNSKTGLFDLLHIADLSLVFGSTVALESSWIKTPCITFEYRSVSFVHTTNSEFIRHINSMEALENALKNLNKKHTSTNPQDSTSVSKDIAEILKTH